MTAPVDRLALEFLIRHPRSAADALQDVDADEAATIVSAAPPRAVAEALARLGSDTATRLLRRMPSDRATKALADCDPLTAAALLRRVEGDDARRALLGALPAARRHEVESYLTYPEDSAGTLMDPAAPIVRDDARAADVAATLRESGRKDEVILVVTDEGELRGTLPTVDVLLAPPDTRLLSLRIRPAPTIDAFASREDVVALLDERRVSVLPVVDAGGRPVGALTQRALASVAEQDVAADMQAMVGASRDERALSPIGFAVRKRLPWLQINLLTAFLAAAVVGLFEATIAQVTALAVLLPVVAGQSGNTGAQALAVTMRGLTLHEIGLRHWSTVAMKEATVGFVNGIAVAVPTMLGVLVWSGSTGIAFVIGLAMVISMTLAGIAGACVPMALQATGQDPAQSSSIVLTTVTDIAGFFSFLGLAALFASVL